MSKNTVEGRLDAPQGQKNAYRLIDTAASLLEAVGELRKTLQDMSPQRVFLDTEFESNRSGTTMCLLQISAGETNFLIDPLRLRTLEPLAELLDNAAIEWILHAGLQDVGLITQCLRIEAPARLFDTQIAWGLLTAESSVGLAYLQFKLLNIRSEKAHQADDWVRRPLQESQLRYGASDVDYLPEMTRQLLATAKGLDRTEVIFAASRDTLNPIKEPPPPLQLSSFRNAWQLNARNQAGMLFLIDWYNALPLDQRRYAPENKALLSIASRLPENVDALGRIKGVPRSTLNHHGSEIVEGLKKAVASARGDDFEPIDPPPYCTFDEIRVDAWLAKLKAELATSLQFAPELVLPGRLLKRMKAGLQAQGVPGLIESLVGWRKDFLLEPLSSFCEQVPPPV